MPPSAAESLRANARRRALCRVSPGDGFAQAFEQAFELRHALAQLRLPSLDAVDAFAETVDALVETVDALAETVDACVETGALAENEPRESDPDRNDRDQIGREGVHAPDPTRANPGTQRGAGCAPRAAPAPSRTPPDAACPGRGILRPDRASHPGRRMKAGAGRSPRAGTAGVLADR